LEQYIIEKNEREVSYTLIVLLLSVFIKRIQINSLAQLLTMFRPQIKLNNHQKISLGILTLSVVLPVMLGYDTFGLGFLTWVIISAISGAETFYAYKKITPLLSISCGIFAGVSIQLFARWYFEDKESFARIETAIPMLGALPAIGIYWLINNTFINPKK
jgi:hypothetical protein